MQTYRFAALASALAVALFAVPASGADVTEDRIQALEQKLLALEDQLVASRATIREQDQVLRAQAAPAASAGSAFDSFLSGLEIGGHVKGSYIYNFNRPNESLISTSQPLCQFNCTHNEFSFDSAKLSIGKEASSPGTAGFQLDLLFGQNADILRALSPDTGGANAFGASDTSLFVQQAYVSYNYNDVTLKFGNFETLLGWELLDSDLNYNISHGILFTWAIPLYHTGIMASGNLSEEIGWSLGLTNGFNNTIEGPTGNDNKGVIGLISFERGGLFTSLSSYYGNDRAFTDNVNSTDDIWIFDYVATYEASDNLSLWLNVDYGFVENSASSIPAGSDDSEYYGLAVGAAFTLSEKTSFAVRGEYWLDEDDTRGACGGLGESADCELWSLTGTLAYKLTDQLTVRGELRYDMADDDTPSDGNIFPSDDTSPPNPAGSAFEDDELFGIVEISYVFD